MPLQRILSSIYCIWSIYIFFCLLLQTVVNLSLTGACGSR
jgi:hypothetical protein